MHEMKNTAPYAVPMNVWRGFPFSAVILLAGLTAVPQEVIEAAKIDGAGPLRRFHYVVVPIVRPILLVGLLYSVVFSFTDFSAVWLLTQGGPYNTTHVFGTYAYNIGINAGDLGMGWASWNSFAAKIDYGVIKAQADALVSAGLKDAGYTYVNLDDCWALPDRDASGNLVPDPVRFPNGIKAVADYVHSKGLKFGFYVTPGIAKNAVTKNTPIEGTSYHAKDIADTSKTEKNYNCKNMPGIGCPTVP